VFDVFAWADFTDFELECEVRKKFVPLRIDLKPIKALTSQKTSISVGPIAVLFGRNNSGKTSVLIGACSALVRSIHLTMDYLGLNRTHSESKYKYELEDLDRHQRESRQEENR